MIRLFLFLAGLRGTRRMALSWLCGAVAALGLPPLDLWPALFVALPVFLAQLQDVAGRRQAFALGWLFGFGYFVVAFHWIGFAFLIDAKTYLWMMPFMVGGLAGSMAIYWGIAALAVHLARLRGLGTAIGFATTLATAEWLRGRLFTGFPWAAPGLQVDGMGTVSQMAAYCGMTGLTFLLVLWAGLGLVLATHGPRRQKLVALLLLLLLPVSWGAGAWRLAKAGDLAPGSSTVRIVQPNVAQDMKWRDDNARAIFDQLQGLSTAPSTMRPGGLTDVTYLLWPESAVPFLIDESPVARTELRRMLPDGTVLMTGAIRREPEAEGTDYRVFNSIITFDGEGAVVARYDKWRLVPGGEFLPFAWLLEPLGFRRVVTVPGNFAAGPGPVTLALPGGLKVAMLVCYEVIFPHNLVDGGDRPAAIVNVTNDGWFGQSTGPYQHLAQARLRTIEQGLPLLRAANTGISAVIDSYGVVLASLPLGTEGVLDAALPAAIAPTPYARWGDTALAAMIALGLAGAGACRPRCRNARETQSGSR
ncbi:MAG: apolipoprotein N-acyltransferase [Alphaproteobacteria bacterium]|nr:apolipoprotein N-acyltransferase [Alphaproteobacteria bacterium]